MMSPTDIARAAHEANRAYCAAIGDTSQVPWEEAPDEQRDACLNGVLGIMSGAVKSPEDSHRIWLAKKETEGWVWGPEKNPELKQHPCMVPFEELPPEQQIKDHLFLGVVKSLLPEDMTHVSGWVMLSMKGSAGRLSYNIPSYHYADMAQILIDLAGHLSADTDQIQQLH